jgi:FkbM family methyltransferase
MPPPRRFADVLADRRLPLRTRLGLLSAEARRRLRKRDVYRLEYHGMSLFLTQDDYEIDWETLKSALVDEPYAADYDGALVLDIGAHKGYFGAYALAEGARTVVSYEPESVNAGFLERSADEVGGDRWRVERTAVSAVAGEAELHVMRASWGHALHPPEKFAEFETGYERVAVASMADVLRSADAAKPGHTRLVVKINTEGEECETVLGTPAGEWTVVDELLVETHSWAPCGADELAEHVAPSGLNRVQSRHERMLQLRRPAPRSG